MYLENAVKKPEITNEYIIQQIDACDAYIESMRGKTTLTQEEQQELILKEIASRELRKRVIKSDKIYFMENFMYIENKSGTTPQDRSILFKLFPEQHRVLKEIDENKKNIILKARQLGITWLVLGYGIHGAISQEQYTVGVLSQSEDYMQEAINRVEYVLQRLPKWFMREYNKENLQYSTCYLYEKKNDEVTIYHPADKDGNRAESYIKGFISTEKAGRSITADLLIFDEWAYHEGAEAVFGAAYPTINRPDSGKFIGLSSNKRGSFFEDIVRDCIDENSMMFNLIFLSVFADPRRTQEWYAETKGTLKNTWMQEYPETIHQALSAGELTAFPEFSPSIHVCEPFPIPDHWVRWFAVDNGYNDPFVWYKGAISEDGQIFVYYEYTRDKNKDEKVHYSDQARKFMESCKIDATEIAREQVEDLRIGVELPEDYQYIVYEKLQYGTFGLDAFNKHHRDQTGKSLMDYYKEGGMNYPAQRAVVDRKLRKDTYHEYLKPYDIEVYNEQGQLVKKKTAKLQIFNTCKFAIKYIPQLVVEENNPTVVADNSRIDNVYDCLGYLVLSSPRNNPSPPKEEESEIEKFKKYKIKSLFRKNRNRKGVIN